MEWLLVLCVLDTREGNLAWPGGYWRTRWRSWLRHCAGSIPDGATGVFHWFDASGRTMVLKSTQPLTEMSTKAVSLGVKAARCVRLTTLLPSCVVCLEIRWASTSWNPHGLTRPVKGRLYLLRVWTWWFRHWMGPKLHALWTQWSIDAFQERK